MKSGNLNFLEPSGPLQACNGTALPFTHNTGLNGQSVCGGRPLKCPHTVCKCMVIRFAGIPNMFVIKHWDFFPSNSDIHDRNTRYNHNLHLHTTNLTLIQKGVLHSGIKTYNHLPMHIKTLSKDPKHFKLKLQSFLLEQTFYSLGEFYQVTSKNFTLCVPCNIHL